MSNEKQQYEVGQKIWHIEIRKLTIEKSYSPNGIHISEHKIIGISKFKICIDTDWFCTFYHKKPGRRPDYEHNLDDIEVSIRVNDDIFGQGIIITLYSSKNPTKKMLEKMASKCAVEIDRKYGFLFNGAKDEIYELVDNFKF